MIDEDILEKLKSVANFMKGMSFDHRIPSDVKKALHDKSQEVYVFIEGVKDE